MTIRCPSLWAAATPTSEAPKANASVSLRNIVSLLRIGQGSITASLRGRDARRRMSAPALYGLETDGKAASLASSSAFTRSTSDSISCAASSITR